jgi:hypothetical protein
LALVATDDPTVSGVIPAAAGELADREARTSRQARTSRRIAAQAGVERVRDDAVPEVVGGDMAEFRGISDLLDGA